MSARADDDFDAWALAIACRHLEQRAELGDSSPCPCPDCNHVRFWRARIIKRLNMARRPERRDHFARRLEAITAVLEGRSA